MKVLSIGDQIRAGTYLVRSRFTRSVLLLDPAQRALFVVDRSIGAGPLHLVVSNPNTFVADEQLNIPLPKPPPIFDSKMPHLSANARQRLLRVLQSSLPRHAHPESLISLFTPPKKLSTVHHHRNAIFQKAFAHVEARQITEAIRLIRGCGEGLTPSGDDFICGWMLALRLKKKFEQAQCLLPHALGNNPISNAFLEMAAKGRVNIALQHLLTSPTDAHIKKVCAFGHSSGADILCGLWFGFIRQ